MPARRNRTKCNRAIVLGFRTDRTELKYVEWTIGLVLGQFYHETSWILYFNVLKIIQGGKKINPRPWIVLISRLWSQYVYTVVSVTCYLKIWNIHKLVTKRTKYYGYLVISKNITLFACISDGKLDPNRLDQRLDSRKTMQNIIKAVEFP